MLKKIILPVVLLIFTQQNFYGMKEKENTNKGNGKAQVGIWGTINNWVNKNETAAFDGSIGLHKKERAFSRYLLQPLQNFTMDTEKYEF